MNLLERDDFASFFTGCIRTESTPAGLLLHRHTAKQIAHYEAASEMWAIRARCNAGIRLHLLTDAAALDLTGRVRHGARNYGGFDVEIDGRHTAGIRLDTSDETRTIRIADLDGGVSRRITVTFPQSAIVELDGIILPDESTVEPVPPSATRYLALGDSITQGMDARGPASTYTVQLSRLFAAELLNLGVGGHIYDLDALDDDLPYRPDLVTIAYGTNDWNKGVTRDEITETVDRYLRRVVGTVASGANVFVLTPIWRAIGEESRDGGTLLEFSDAIASAAGAIDRITVIDGTTLVPHLPDLFVDGTHPNDEGFLHYALNLARAIRQ